MSHTIKCDGFTLTGNSDLSGWMTLIFPGGVAIALPGPLLRAWFDRHCSAEVAEIKLLPCGRPCDFPCCAGDGGDGAGCESVSGCVVFAGHTGRHGCESAARKMERQSAAHLGWLADWRCRVVEAGLAYLNNSSDARDRVHMDNLARLRGLIHEKPPGGAL